MQPDASPSLPAQPAKPFWPLGQRMLHWLLAISVIVGFVTHEAPGWLHNAAGYVALGCAVLRLSLGLATQGSWQLLSRLHGLRTTWAYALATWQKREPRYLGHNPLGAWMMLTLLVNTAVVGVTGFMMETDAFFGVAWVGNLHDISGHLYLPLTGLHVAGAVFASIRHKENLVAAMLHGRKAAAQGNDQL